MTEHTQSEQNSESNLPSPKDNNSGDKQPPNSSENVNMDNPANVNDPTIEEPKTTPEITQYDDSQEIKLESTNHPSKEKLREKFGKLPFYAKITIIITILGIFCASVLALPGAINEVKKLFQPPTKTPTLETQPAAFVPVTDPPTAKPPSPTESATVEPTETEPPDSTLTSDLTSTPEPMPTSPYDFIIGVFEQNSNCGEKDKNEQIITGLRDLHFEVEKVPIGSTDYDRFRVLYMPYGWSCTLKDYNLESISDFLYRTSTGLLIGDPRPEELITLRLFSYKIYFDSLSPEAVSSLGPPVFDNDEMKIKYEHIFAGFYDKDLPTAETKLSLPRDAEGYHRVVIQYGKNEYRGWYNSFVASSNVTPRFVIMPGSEYAVNDDGISDDLMIKIIEWLAHSSTSK